MINCVLFFDSQEIECKIENRPKCEIEESVDETGVYRLVGEAKWFPLKLIGQYELWQGKKDVMLKFLFRKQAGYELTETWHLHNCEIENNSLNFASVGFNLYNKNLIA